jgi:hypothetical protein
MSKITNAHLNSILQAKTKDTYLTSDKNHTQVGTTTGGRVAVWFKSLTFGGHKGNLRGKELLVDSLLKELGGRGMLKQGVAEEIRAAIGVKGGRPLPMATAQKVINQFLPQDKLVDKPKLTPEQLIENLMHKAEAKKGNLPNAEGQIVQNLQQQKPLEQPIDLKVEQPPNEIGHRNEPPIERGGNRPVRIDKIDHNKVENDDEEMNEIMRQVDDIHLDELVNEFSPKGSEEQVGVEPTKKRGIEAPRQRMAETVHSDFDMEDIMSEVNDLAEKENLKAKGGGTGKND